MPKMKGGKNNKSNKRGGKTSGAANNKLSPKVSGENTKIEDESLFHMSMENLAKVEDEARSLDMPEDNSKVINMSDKEGKRSFMSGEPMPSTTCDAITEPFISPASGITPLILSEVHFSMSKEELKPSVMSEDGDNISNIPEENNNSSNCSDEASTMSEEEIKLSDMTEEVKSLYILEKEANSSSMSKVEAKPVIISEVDANPLDISKQNTKSVITEIAAKFSTLSADDTKSMSMLEIETISPNLSDEDKLSNMSEIEIIQLSDIYDDEDKPPTIFTIEKEHSTSRNEIIPLYTPDVPNIYVSKSSDVYVNVEPSRMCTYETELSNIPIEKIEPPDMFKDQVEPLDKSKDEIYPSYMSKDETYPSNTSKDELTPMKMSKDEIYPSDTSKDDVSHTYTSRDDIYISDMSKEDLLTPDMSKDESKLYMSEDDVKPCETSEFGDALSTPVSKPSSSCYTPKYNYNNEQWSPINRSGKKTYDIELMMQIKDDPLSMQKPEAPLLESSYVLKNIPSKPSKPEAPSFTTSLRPMTGSLFHPFAMGCTMGGHKPHTTPPREVRKRTPSGKNNMKHAKGHAQASSTKNVTTNKPAKPVIQVNLTLREEVKLNETESAWKPTRLRKQGMSEEEQKDEEVYKKFRGILNKLTPQKFETLLDKVKSLEINSQKRLERVIDLIFQKAIDEPNFSEAYAVMCNKLSMLKVTLVPMITLLDNVKPVEINSEKGLERVIDLIFQKAIDEPNFSEAYAVMCNKLSMLKVPADNPTNPEQCVNFRVLIITKCQQQFETNKTDEQVLKLEKELEECSDPVKKKELQLMLNEENRKIRMKSVGNVRFIGELYKRKMLTCKIMNYCMRYLVEKLEEEKLECLCRLLTTIGQQLENEGKHHLDNIFREMQEIVDKKANKISSRIKFMIQDVIQLRRRRWLVKNILDNQPKLIDQV